MDPLSRFSRARLRVRFGVVAVATAFVASAIGAGVFAIGGFGGTPSSPSPTAKLTLVAARTPTPGPTPTASPNPTPSPSPSPTPNDLAHRPFTVLVLGGDDVLLTDAVIVVGIDPLKRTIAYASIPRDTIDILLPGGGVWRDRKINEFYKDRKSVV